MEKGVRQLVLDSGAFITGAKLDAFGPDVKYHTLPDLASEIKDEASRHRLRTFPFPIEERQVSEEALRAVMNFARATGDIASLSVTDLRMLALAYLLEKEAHGITHLRTQPQTSTAVKTQTIGGAVRGARPGPGAGPGASGDASSRAGADSDGEDELEASGAAVPSFARLAEVPVRPFSLDAFLLQPAAAAPAATVAAKQRAPVAIVRTSAPAAAIEPGAGAAPSEPILASDPSKLAAPRGWGKLSTGPIAPVSLVADDPTPAEAHGVSKPRAPLEVPAIPRWQPAASTARAAGGAGDEDDEGDDEGEGDVREEEDGAGPAGLESKASDADAEAWVNRPVSSAGAALAYDDDDDDDDDTEAGEWITPDNIALADQKHALGIAHVAHAHTHAAASPAAEVGTGSERKATRTAAAQWESTVACITTDYAMQNVLLQMGLRVLTVGGFAVTSLRQFVLRCHACYTVTKEMDRQFCPHCGNNTLVKASIFVDAKGVQHVRGRMNVSKRGKQYSIPKPRGGRAGAGHTTADGRVRRGDLRLAEDEFFRNRASASLFGDKPKSKKEEDLFKNAVGFALHAAGPQAKQQVVGYGRSNPNVPKAKPGNRRKKRRN